MSEDIPGSSPKVSDPERKRGDSRNIKSLQVVSMEAPPRPLPGSLGEHVWGE